MQLDLLFVHEIVNLYRVYGVILSGVVRFLNVPIFSAKYFICCVVLVLFAYGSCTYLGFLRFSLCCRFYFLLKPWAFSMRAWGVFYESLGHFLMRAWEFCIRPWPFCSSIDCLYIISIDISTFKISSIRLTIIGTILSRFHPFSLQGSCNICFYLFALLFFFLFFLDPAVLPIPY